MNRLIWLIWLALLGCSSSPAQVAGDYSIGLTDEDNGCMFANWTAGTMTSGITMTVTQQSADATAVVTGGGSELVLDAVFGANTFTGSVDGDAIDLTLDGTNSNTTGNCTYTYNGVITATLATDTFTGKITYTGATNNNSDCATIQGCVSYQNFDGSRPPQ